MLLQKTVLAHRELKRAVSQREGESARGEEAKTGVKKSTEDSSQRYVKIKDFGKLFYHSSRILVGLEYWDMSGVKDFYEAFAETSYSWELSDWEVSEGANVERVFFDSALEREDRLPKWAE